jgi:hypothetical protein
MRPREPHRLQGAVRPTLEEFRAWIGRRVDDVDGSGLGRLEGLIPDQAERDVDWLVVNEFRFGRGRRFFVPAGEAVGGGGRVWVPYDRALVLGSAGRGATHHTPQAERRLQEYWAGAVRRAA